MVTPLLEMMGGKYIARDRFLARLETAKRSAQAVKFKI
jgi:hypothetical protein